MHGSPNPWPVTSHQELPLAEARYQEAVEQYMALVNEANSADLDPSTYLQQLDEAKQAVNRCREYYHSLREPDLVEGTSP